jgi:hypothetical protein
MKERFCEQFQTIKSIRHFSNIIAKSWGQIEAVRTKLIFSNIRCGIDELPFGILTEGFSIDVLNGVVVGVGFWADGGVLASHFFISVAPQATTPESSNRRRPSPAQVHPCANWRAADLMACTVSLIR